MKTNRHSTLLKGWAPERVTAIAAAAFAKLNASRSISLWAQITANAPQNVKFHGL